ncbi:MAG TPA: hypothetical protein VMU85_09535 [Stellaceae bacterium]|nr:hypothetical protein [Stellaceae bacterium]
MTTARTLALLALLVLAGCTAGRNFVRPTADSVTLGTTTRADVLQKYGQPSRQATATISFDSAQPAAAKGPFDVVLAAGSYVSLNYTFVERTPGLMSDSINDRSVTFLFWNDKLVSYRFVSNFQQDSSNFDESKLSALQRAKTTKADLEQLLGAPSGRSIYPFVQQQGQEILAYGYEVIDLKTRERSAKGLQVLFAPDGTLVDYRFGSDAAPLPPPTGGSAPVYVPIITPKR